MKQEQKLKKIRKEDLNEYNIKILEDYIDYCKLINFSEATINNHKRTITRFLNYNGIDNYLNYSYEELLNFLSTLNYDNKLTYNVYISRIKLFLNYMYENKLMNNNYSFRLQTYRVGKNSTIPSVWKDDEIISILSLIDRESIIGKRDYAMIYLAILTCLRSSDIVNLKLKNLNFKDKTLSIVQQKNQKEVVIPLCDSLIECLIDYLKNSRGQIASEYLFLSINNKKLNSSSTYEILNKYLCKTDIDLNNRKRGFHSFRHTTLNNLFNDKETSITTLSEISGHSNIESLNSYVKVDITRLRECTLTLNDFGGIQC